MSATSLFGKPLIFTRPGKDIRDRLDVHFNEPRWDDFDWRLNAVLKKTEQRTLDKAVCQFNVGLTTAATQFYSESGIPFLRGENVYERRIDLSSQTFVPLEKHEEWKSSQVNPGDIVINLVGNIGDACMIPIDFGAAQINRALGRIIADPAIASAQYILEFLNSDLGKGQLIRYSQGGMQRRFNHPDGEYILIPILANEKEFLDAITRARGLIGRLSEKSKEYWQKRYSLADDLDLYFVNGAPKTPVENASGWLESMDPICRLHTQERNVAIVSVKNGIDRIDTRYYLPCRLREVVAENKSRWGKLSDFVEISRESYVSDGALGHIAIDRMPDDPWGSFEIGEGYVGPTTYLEKGDMAFSRLMPTIMNGKCFLTWETVTGSPEFIRIRAPKDYQDALRFWLKTRYVREYLLANVRGSSASQKRFTEDDLAACPVPKFLFETPEAVVSACNQLLKKANESSQKASKLDALAVHLTNDVKSNIFNLLDPAFFSGLEKTVEEALQ